MTHAHTDKILIAGAGPVGLALALALARLGIPSRVLERKLAPAPQSRATLIPPAGAEVMHDLGVLPQILAEGQRNDAIRILRADDRKRLLTFDFTQLASQTPTPYAIALSQDRTEAILRAACDATGLVDIRHGHGLTGFTQDEFGVSVTDSLGETHRAAFLLGTDGAKSTVREIMGLHLEGKTYPTRAALGDVRIDPAFDTLDGWIADPMADSFTIAIRFASGTWRIIIAAIDDSITEDSLPDRFATVANRLFGRDAWQETLWTADYRKHERRAPAYVAGRVVLAGDAAHLNSPAGGQGLNAGLGDARFLARKLAEALADPAKANASLRAYETERVRVFDTKVRGMTDALETMESAPAWARRLGFSMLGALRLLGIERVVARRLSMIEGTYHRM
jgi:3-(3-hydroxy-phenyl)propionate hydroxylase